MAWLPFLKTKMKSEVSGRERCRKKILLIKENYGKERREKKRERENDIWEKFDKFLLSKI